MRLDDINSSGDFESGVEDDQLAQPGKTQLPNSVDGGDDLGLGRASEENDLGEVTEDTTDQVGYRYNDHSRN